MGQFGGPMGGPPPDPWGPAKSKAMGRGAPMDGPLDPGSPQGGKPDAETGYVEAQGGPKCGNCTHLDQGSGMCPVVGKQVAPDNGCCNSWDDGSGQPGITGAGAAPEAMGSPMGNPMGQKPQGI